MNVYTAQQNIKAQTLTAEQIRKRRRINQNIPLMLMFLPVIIYFIIFKYAPMVGLQIAFRDYNFTDGIFKSPWVGLKYFKMVFTYPATVEVIRNTLVLGILKVITGFPFPIIVALLLNEVRKIWFKRVIQTVIYMPHFLSWVIVGGMVVTIFSQQTGIVNHILYLVSGHKYPFLIKEASWVVIFLGSGVWKEAGFGAIIYLAALSNIDTSLYEAAAIDGASKIKQVWYITLPGISSTIILLLVLNIGHIAEVGFDQVYILSNQSVLGIADVVSTYVYRIGLQSAQFSLTTAVGLFQSVLNLILIVGANFVANKYEQGLW